jgi:hypothetical protein
MRTTLDLDEGLMTALMRRFPGVSRTKAVERAIESYLRADSAAELIALAGSVEIEDMSHLREWDRGAAAHERTG